MTLTPSLWSPTPKLEALKPTNPLLPGEDGAARLMRESVIIILSSPYSIGTLVAVLLNAVIPRDAEEGPSHEAGPSEDTTEEQTALQAAV